MDKYIIFDLDGTLIRGNSFTAYVKFSFRHIPGIRLRLAAIVAMRKLRLISHFKAKKMIMSLTSGRFNNTLLRAFLQELNEDVRPRFRKILEKHDARLFLATAAPREYAEPLGKMLGFHRVCATNSSLPYECRGEHKVEALRQAGVQFSETTEVYTDHADDLPLIRANAAGINTIVK